MQREFVTIYTLFTHAIEKHTQNNLITAKLSRRASTRRSDTRKNVPSARRPNRFEPMCVKKWIYEPRIAAAVDKLKAKMKREIKRAKREIRSLSSVNVCVFVLLSFDFLLLLGNEYALKCLTSAVNVITDFCLVYQLFDWFNLCFIFASLLVRSIVFRVLLFCTCTLCVCVRLCVFVAVIQSAGWLCFRLGINVCQSDWNAISQHKLTRYARTVYPYAVQVL